jgi:MFS family permease
MPSQHRRSFWILFLGLICVGLGQSMLFAILPPAARKIGLTPFQVSTIFAASATIWVFVSPMWGRRSDVMGRRPVILIGLLGFALSMVLLAAMVQIGLARLLPITIVYPLMVASRCVFALLGSGTGPASQAYIADRTDVADRPAGLALLNAAFALGQTFGPAVGALLSLVSLLFPIYSSAGFAILSGAVIWFLLPEEGPPHRSGDALPARLSFRDRRIVPFFLLDCCVQAVRATTAITLAFFLQDKLGLSAGETARYAGIGFSVQALAGLLSQLVIVQRLRPTARRMIDAGVPISLVGCVLLALRGPFAVDVAAMATLGVGLGLLRPGSSAGASLSVELSEQGAVAGLSGAIGVTGNIFGPLLGTALYSVTPIAPYAMNAVIMIAALFVAHRSARVRALRG